MKSCKKRNLTLIEIMIVMFLIMLIMGVVAYNYRGALDEGKAFKTKAGIDQIETVLEMAVAQDPELLENIPSEWEEIVLTAPTVKNPASLIKDGWGESYQVRVEDGRVVVSSKRFEEYKKTHATMFKE